MKSAPRASPRSIRCPNASGMAIPNDKEKKENQIGGRPSMPFRRRAASRCAHDPIVHQNGWHGDATKDIEGNHRLLFGHNDPQITEMTLFLESVPGAIATGSDLSVNEPDSTRSLSLPVLTPVICVICG